MPKKKLPDKNASKENSIIEDKEINTQDIEITSKIEKSSKTENQEELTDQVLPPETGIETLKNTGQSQSSRGQFIVEGTARVNTRLAKCCQPKQGDPIRGYLTQGGAVTVHHQNCRSLRKLNKDRMLSVHWTKEGSNDQETQIP